MSDWESVATDEAKDARIRQLEVVILSEVKQLIQWMIDSRINNTGPINHAEAMAKRSMYLLQILENKEEVDE